ncbi:MAG: hypothetical protein KIS87_04760 [Phycisphaeraceae bacterium]|nr:hypothetical protein [Phycisphaeraceae bacterium]
MSAEDFFIDDGDVPALIAAIEAATANGEADTIHLAADGTYTLTAPYSGLTGLPSITTEIAINGNGAAIQPRR